MDIGKCLKRSLVGTAGLLAISASSAVNKPPHVADAWGSIPERLHGLAGYLEAMLAPAPAATPDSLWMALLAMACMAVVVKRKSGI